MENGEMGRQAVVCILLMCIGGLKSYLLLNSALGLSLNMILLLWSNFRFKRSAESVNFLYCVATLKYSGATVHTITFPHKIRDVDRDQLDQHSCTRA